MQSFLRTRRSASLSLVSSFFKSLGASPLVIRVLILPSALSLDDFAGAGVFFSAPTAGCRFTPTCSQYAMDAIHARRRAGGRARWRRSGFAGVIRGAAAATIPFEGKNWNCAGTFFLTCHGQDWIIVISLCAVLLVFWFFEQPKLVESQRQAATMRSPRRKTRR